MSDRLKSTFLLIFLAACTQTLAQNAPAEKPWDVVLLKSGAKIVGKIEDQGMGTITVRLQSGGLMTVEIRDVSRIEENSHKTMPHRVYPTLVSLRGSIAQEPAWEIESRDGNRVSGATLDSLVGSQLYVMSGGSLQTLNILNIKSMRFINESGVLDILLGAGIGIFGGGALGFIAGGMSGKDWEGIFGCLYGAAIGLPLGIITAVAAGLDDVVEVPEGNQDAARSILESIFKME